MTDKKADNPTPDQNAKAAKMRAAGHPPSVIAHHLGMTREHVCNIIGGDPCMMEGADHA